MHAVRTKPILPRCAHPVLQQHEVEEAAEAVEVDLGHHHVDGVGGDEHQGEQRQAEQVAPLVSHLVWLEDAGAEGEEELGEEDGEGA